MFELRCINKLKIKNLALQLSIFSFLYFISMVILDRSFYLFRWTADNRYLYIWVMVGFLIIFDKKNIACILTVGNVIGVLLGQFLGDYIQSINMAKITPEMTDEMIWSSGLMSHPGFHIWIFTLFLSLVIALFIQTWLLKAKEQRKNLSISLLKSLVFSIIIGITYLLGMVVLSVIFQSWIRGIFFLALIIGIIIRRRKFMTKFNP